MTSTIREHDQHAAAYPREHPSSLWPMLGSGLVLPERSRAIRWAIGAFVASIIGGAALAFGGVLGFGAIGVVLLCVIIWQHPPMAGYVMISLGPLIVGFSRDQVLPRLRPNEALLFVVVAVLVARWLVTSRRLTFHFNRIDALIGLIVVCGTVLPLAVQVARLNPIPLDDLLYAAVFVRIALLYAVIRATITTELQVRAALALSLGVASFLGILAVMDSMNLANTAERLNRFFPTAAANVDDGRGAATVGNPIGLGVYMGINALIGLALYFGGQRPRIWIALGVVCTSLGVLGSGQVGPTLSFCIGVVAFGLITHTFGSIAKRGLVLAVVACILLFPIINARITGLDAWSVSSAQRAAIETQDPATQAEALRQADPGSSWDVRLYNLERFFVPAFDEPRHIVWGVTPQARVESPIEGEEFIWIESGHLWLLWTGGIPMFVTWFVFLAVAMFTSRRVLRSRPGAVGMAAAAAFGGLWIVNVAQTFDPHMTLRGTTEILYPLLALTMTGWAAQQQWERHQRDLTALEDDQQWSEFDVSE